MPIVKFSPFFLSLPLPPQHLHPRTIGDNDIVTAVGGGMVDGLVLAQEDVGDGRGHAAEGGVGGVDVVP